MIVAKMSDGKVVQVVRFARTVQFSKAEGWFCVCMDFHHREIFRQTYKWVPADTRFEWVREFSF